MTVLTPHDRRALSAVWQDSTLSAIIASGDAGAFDRLLLETMRRRRQTPKFFFQAGRAREIATALKHAMPEQAEIIVQRATDVMEYRFPSADGEFVPYSVQLQSGFSWYANPTADPQFPCALNRHRFWVELAMAHLFTGQTEYSDALLGQFHSWCEQSPPLPDPTKWKDVFPVWNLLDAAIRADTWIWTYFLVLHAPGWTKEANTLFLHRLWQHGDFLHRLTPTAATLEESVAPNWTIMQAQELLNIALMFPEFAQSAQWEDHAASTLQACLETQFRADGGHIEQSPSYQEGCLRWLAEPFQLAHLNGKPLGKMLSQLERACDFFYQLLQPDGSVPALSDSDRFRSDIMGQMGILFRRAEWTRFDSPTIRDAWFVGGLDEMDAVTHEQPGKSTRPAAIAYKESGYFVMRSGDDPDAVQIILDCGEIGGWHGHYDLLSFELYGFGQPLIPDPGRLIYDEGPDRKWLLSTRAHNTICVNGENHASVETADLHLAKWEWEVESTHVLIACHHDGYRHLPGSPRVGRSLWFDRRATLIVVDWAEATEPQDYLVSWNFPVDQIEQPFPRCYHAGLSGADVFLNIMPAAGQKHKHYPSFWSPNYGEKLPASRVEVQHTGKLAIFATVIQVAQTAKPKSIITAQWSPPLEITNPAVICLTEDGIERAIEIASPFQ